MKEEEDKEDPRFPLRASHDRASEVPYDVEGSPTHQADTFNNSFGSRQVAPEQVHVSADRTPTAAHTAPIAGATDIAPGANRAPFRHTVDGSETHDISVLVPPRSRSEDYLPFDVDAKDDPLPSSRPTNSINPAGISGGPFPSFKALMQRKATGTIVSVDDYDTPNHVTPPNADPTQPHVQEDRLVQPTHPRPHPRPYPITNAITNAITKPSANPSQHPRSYPSANPSANPSTCSCAYPR